MKKILFTILGIVFSGAVFAQQGIMKFKAESHNFGKTEQGKPITHEFVFTNKGTGPLTILKVESSCGCTTPEFTKTPVAPGKTGIIRATFDAIAGGIFNKPLTVISDGESPSITIYLRGEVVKTGTSSVIQQ